MIDKVNEVFSNVSSTVRSEYPGASITGEYVRRPSKFPCVTLDETQNVTVGNLEDSTGEEKFAGVTYRLQVFSNKRNGKRAEAREIFALADKAMLAMGFRRVTYTTTPEFYESTIYSITATYEAIVSADGVIYKR